MSEPVYRVVWPLAKSRYEVVPLGRRSKDWSGKTVCQLWNYDFKGNTIFAVLWEELAKRFPGIKFVDYSAFGKIDKMAEFVDPAALRQQGCDLVVNGIGG